MKEQLEAIRAGALAAIGAAGNTGELEALRVQYLGKKGELTAVLKQMGKLSAEERPVMGQLANAVRADVESAIEQQSAVLAEKALEERLSVPRGRKRCVGQTRPQGRNGYGAWPKPEKKKTDPVKKPPNCCNSSAACRVSENTA